MHKYFSYLSLIILTFFVYSFSLFNPFIWDDEQFIYKNQYVTNFEIKKIFTESTTAGAGEVTTYYRPLTSLSFAVDYAVWQNNVFGFHLTNIFLRISAGLLLFIFLQKLKITKKASFFITLVFLLHPVQTEAVTYINSRGDSLYLLFCLLSVLSLEKFLFLENKNNLNQKNTKINLIKIYNLEINFEQKHFLFFSLLFYLFAILSKEIATSFLVIIFWIVISSNNFLKEKSNFLLKNIFVLISFITIFISYILFRIYILNIPIKQNYSNTDLYIFQENFYFRVLTFLSSLWEYLTFIVFPIHLHMERIKEVVTIFNYQIFLVIFLILFTIMMAIYEFKKNKTNFIFFGGLWFFSMLLPVSGILPINGLIYEHWLYSPIIGFLIIAYGFYKLFKFHKDFFYKNIYEYFLIFLCIILSLLTIKQNYIWGDKVRFYEYTLGFSQTARLYNNLGISYAEIGELNKAVDSYKKALEITDQYPQIHLNLANAYRDLNNKEQSKYHLEKALQLLQGSSDIK